MLGPVLALAAWLCAFLAARSVFGDVLVSDEAAKQRIIASADLYFRLYSALALVSLIAAIIVAVYTWRTSRIYSRVTIGVVALFVLVVAGTAVQ
jgi:hypothetical protein